ncbi:MAG: DUF6754 domain-containing protein [Planctomycetaceae bacterium]
MTDRVSWKLPALAIVIALAGVVPQPARAESQAESESANTESTDPPRPPKDVTAIDRPDDAGDGIIVGWTLSLDDLKKVPDGKTRKVVRYEILRKTIQPDKTDDDKKDEFKLVGEATFQKTSFVDADCERNATYLYQVVAVEHEDSKSEAVQADETITAILQYWDTRRTWFLVMLVLVCGSVILFIQLARGGMELKIRKIAGLEAVEEAVGRATEMGRSCLFIPGILDINDMQTVAGITVLSRVAALAAEYDAMLEVPTSRSLVMTTAQETVQAAFLGAGRPDAYNEDNIYYLTDEQFGYVAGVTGTMVRDKPAACFYMGAFFAESLILAETGNSIGAIQIAGTAMPAQLPFFVAACDYTLIGEEFFAASAYLSGEQHQLGSLKGQDVGKVIGGLLIVVGCLVATFASLANVDDTVMHSVVSFLTDNVLGNKGFLP